MNEIGEIFEKYPNIGRRRLSKIAGVSEEDARAFCRERKKEVKGNTYKKGVVLWDIHYPYHDKNCINIIHDFITDFKPDYFILGGDQMDMDSISVFNKDKPLLREGKRLKKEYQGFQKDILDYFESILPCDCINVFLIGNHEYRTVSLIEREPDYDGWVNIENNLRLEKYSIIPYNHTYRVGNMYFAHGEKCSRYHCAVNLQTYGKQIFTGHVHTNQIFTSNSPVDALPKQGVSVGCLCNLNPQWMRDRPNHWIHQFMFFYVFPDGSFVYYLPIIIHGRAVINNKLYIAGEGDIHVSL